MIRLHAHVRERECTAQVAGEEWKAGGKVGAINLRAGDDDVRGNWTGGVLGLRREDGSLEGAVDSAGKMKSCTRLNCQRSDTKFVRHKNTNTNTDKHRRNTHACKCLISVVRKHVHRYRWFILIHSLICQYNNTTREKKKLHISAKTALKCSRTSWTHLDWFSSSHNDRREFKIIVFFYKTGYDGVQCRNKTEKNFLRKLLNGTACTDEES